MKSGRWDVVWLILFTLGLLMVGYQAGAESASNCAFSFTGPTTKVAGMWGLTHGA